MTYISKTIGPLYELNSLVSNYSLAIEPFAETNSLLDNASILFHEVGVRITALFFTALTLLLVPFFTIPDLCCLNLRVISERDLLSPAIFKVNFAFFKAVTLGVAAPLLAIIAPKYVYKKSVAHLALVRYTAEIFAQIPENLQALARKIDVDLRGLNHANATLANWREELVAHLATTLPRINLYQFEEAEDSNFLTFNFLLYREAFRLLLRAHFSEADVQRVMPNNNQRLRHYQDNLWQHSETQRQFRFIIKRALKETRTELVDTSKYDKLKLEVEKVKTSKKLVEQQALEIERLLNEHFILPRAAESPEAAVQREIDRLDNVRCELQQLKRQSKAIPTKVAQDKLLQDFLTSKGIILQKESVDQVMKRIGANLEAIRLKELEIRTKYTAVQIAEIIQRTTWVTITANESPRDAIARYIRAFKVIQSTVEEMQNANKSEEELNAFLETKSILRQIETPEQACERLLDDYKSVKGEVQKLVQAKKRTAEIIAYLKTKSIVLQPAQTAIEAIETAKTSRTFTSEEIASMDVAPYAAMFDRAIFRIVEMATIEFANNGNEILILVHHPDDQPEDLKLSKENNIFGLFEAATAVHDSICNISTEKMHVLRWLLTHKDLDPTQVFDPSEKNVPPSTSLRPSVVIKGAKLIKSIYNKIVEVRQNLIDRRLRAEGGWGADFTQAFQAP